MDGSTLVEALHGRGINVRYLGKLAAMLAAVPQLKYLNRIAVSELVLRSAKHIFTSYMQVNGTISSTHGIVVIFVYLTRRVFLLFQGTELMCLSAAISHFLNCLLSSAQLTHPQQSVEEVGVVIMDDVCLALRRYFR